MTAKRSLFRRPLATFAADRRGNVAMIWALTALGILSFVGIAMDFSNANAAKRVLQNAADSAALVAERMADKPLSERQAAAEQYFRASLADYAYGADATISVPPVGRAAALSFRIFITSSADAGRCATSRWIKPT